MKIMQQAVRPAAGVRAMCQITDGALRHPPDCAVYVYRSDCAGIHSPARAF